MLHVIRWVAESDATVIGLESAGERERESVERVLSQRFVFLLYGWRFWKALFCATFAHERDEEVAGA